MTDIFDAIDPGFIGLHTYATPRDVVLVSGTLIEGIGNKFSDIDVYVLCERRPKVRDIHPDRHMRTLTVGRQIVDADYAAQAAHAEEEVLIIQAETPRDCVKLDVEFKTFREVAALADQVRSIFDYARCHLLLLTVQMPERDKMFLHRLHFCRVLQGEATYRQIVNTIHYDRYTYLLYRWIGADYSIFLDIIGAAAAGEWLRALEMARSNALQQTLAYLHLVGLSNFDPKWLITYLDAAVLQGSFDRALLETFRSLYCLQDVDCRQTASLQRYVERALDYADTVLNLSRDPLLRNPALPDLRQARRLIDADNGEVCGLYAALERAYRGRVYGFAAPPSRYFLRGALPSGGPA